MENSLKVLRGHDIRPTQQRLEVHGVLLNNGKHLTADQIYERVKLRMPAVSLATVYTVLDLFKQKHVINEIRIQFDKSCFEARIDPHHHFLCKSCDEISDLNMKPCKALEQREVDGNIIEELQGYFYGTCKNCREVNNGK
ncbi:MAG: transcriptional repressor [Candidatus Omnitrophica bacterium]|nr:transcriptional repressor [Candidatus Omnitrophota bacterium]